MKNKRLIYPLGGAVLLILALLILILLLPRLQKGPIRIKTALKPDQNRPQARGGRRRGEAELRDPAFQNGDGGLRGADHGGEKCLQAETEGLFAGNRRKLRREGRGYLPRAESRPCPMACSGSVCAFLCAFRRERQPQPCGGCGACLQRRCPVFPGMPERRGDFRVY